MLSQNLRPHSWDKVVGQDHVVQVLKTLSKSPERSPRSLVLAGSFGSGKTTCARIFAKEVNNINDKGFDLNTSPFYYEYDATVVGKIDSIRELRESFTMGIAGFWKVVVFDEIHAASQAAQTALLKVLEDFEGKVFFIFCTTHVDKIIQTIRSRSLELQFGTVSYRDIVKHLEIVQGEIGALIPDDIRRTIALRSGGHMRDVHMLVDKYLLIGEDSFRMSVSSTVEVFGELFLAMHNNDREILKSSLDTLLTFPLTYLERDMAEFMFEASRAFFLKDESSIAVVNDVIATYGDLTFFVHNYFSDWMANIFRSGHDFYTGMLAFYQLIEKRVNKPAEDFSKVRSLKERAVIR